MAKIVIELQHEALKSNFDIMNLLRKAYLVARKLKLQEFEDWINNELNGYNNILKLSGQFFTLFSNEHLLAYPSASLSKIAINLDLILEK